MSELLIPKVFHTIWLGDKPLPKEYADYGRSWIKYHPDWTLKVWNSKNMIKLKNQEAYDNAEYFAQKADIARYEIIYNFGGVYIDTDFECLKNIEGLLKNVEAFAAYESEGIICISILGCTPKNPVFKELIDGIPQSIEVNKRYPITYQTGPLYATKKLKNRDDITVFRQELFYPYLWNEKHRKREVFPKAYAVHHWAGSWVKAEDWQVKGLPRVEDFINEEDSCKANNIKSTFENKGSYLKSYTVKPGDTLIKICRCFKIPLKDILRVNNIKNPNSIFVGQEIYLP